MKDAESYFGVLLMEHGFINNDDLESGLSHHVPKKPIGEKLVDASHLSPHAIYVVQKEQMIIRLSKIIKDASAQIEFQDENFLSDGPRIEGDLLSKLSADWISSKISKKWLKAFYNTKLNDSMSKGEKFKTLSLVSDKSILKQFNQLEKIDVWPISLQTLYDTNAKQEESFFKGLHFLLINGILRFSESSESRVINLDAQKKRLERLWQEMRSEEDHFKVLSLAQNARSKEVQKAYQEMAKALHPDKLTPHAPKEVLELANQVFSRITEAYRVLSNDQQKAAYLAKMEKGVAEEALMSEALFDKAMQHLETSRFREARKIFEKVMRMKGRRSDCMIYLVWALIMEKRSKENRQDLLEHCSSLMSQVAHEDRHTAAYFFVKGLCLRLSADYQKAFGAFKHSLSLNPDFIDAKRELASLKSKKSEKTNIFTDDLSTVVKRMFSAKKSG
jgi:tetratricopeptide (TPR) repeat protein